MASDDASQQKLTKDKHRYQSHHRMHRSAVRPFFCCGSQVSLNSITELKDLPLKVVDDDYEDITDSDELADDIESLQINTTLKIEKPFQRPTRVSGSKRKKGTALQEKSNSRNTKRFWTLKLRGKLQVTKRTHYASESELSSPTADNDVCVCTSYKASGETDQAKLSSASPRASTSSDTVSLSMIAHLVPPTGGACGSSSRDTINSRHNRDREVARLSPNQASSSQQHPNLSLIRNNFSCVINPNAPLPFVNNFNQLYPTNDIDEQLKAQRLQEMEQGIEVEDIWIHKSDQKDGDNGEPLIDSSESTLFSSMDRPIGQYPSYGAMGLLSPQADVPPSSSRQSIDATDMVSSTLSLNNWPGMTSLIRPPLGVHTQVDYKHYLVPDMDQIVNSSFYWGIMDRYQAEKLIENKPEGTFLLRDSAQDEFLFSVSFRRYGRSLHARIEQWNHKFSFDSRDPGVFATDSVCGLIEHYKDPSCCMFFEPMLTLPLHRNFPFSLQHLARATICSPLTYDSINKLTLPKQLKEYLRCYHYKQKVRVRRFENVP